MDNFKTWYTDRKGKYILFFGFYLIFFIVLAFYIRSVQTNNPKETPKEETVEKKETITSYDLNNLINNDYEYHITIIDNENEIVFNGTKNNVDYANYENKYFLDIYNINQLLKKSKLVSSENYILSYELKNKEIDEVLLTNKVDGDNKIMVHVKENGEVQKIVLDLSTYFEKDRYEITIDYVVGESNENSSS